jgi:hypothetical protein
MKKTDLQIYIGEKIIHSKLSKEAKLQLLTYVQHEADIHQLMALKLDGKIIKIEDDSTRQIIEARFNNLCEGPTGLLIATGVAAAAVVANAIRRARKRHRLCTETCSNKPDHLKKECLKGCKATYNSKMKAARKAGAAAGKKAKQQSSNESINEITGTTVALVGMGAIYLKAIIKKAKIMHADCKKHCGTKSGVEGEACKQKCMHSYQDKIDIAKKRAKAAQAKERVKALSK